MITKTILVMFVALLSLINFPNALAHEQLSTTLSDPANTLYCAESDANDGSDEYEDEEEPDCE